MVQRWFKLNLLCLFFMIFLAIVGFADLIRCAFKWLVFKSKKAPTKEVKIPIYRHCENIEFIIRKIIFKYTWLKEYQSLKIIIINNGADVETLKICNALKRKTAYLSIT